MGVVIVEGEGAVLRLNLGHPIVINGDFDAKLCAEVREPIELSFGVVSGVSPGIHVLDGIHVPQKEGAFWGIFRHLLPIGLNRQNDLFFAQKFNRLICEKLTIFSYGQAVIGIYVSLAFRRYRQVQDRSGVLRNICKNEILISGAVRRIFGHSSKASMVP